MKQGKPKRREPRPHVVITIDAYVYRRTENGRLALVEQATASYRQYES